MTGMGSVPARSSSPCHRLSLASMPPFLDTEPANNVEQSEGGKRDRQDVPVHVRDHRLLTIAMERGQTPRGDPVRETRPESEPSAPAAWRDAGGGAIAPLPGHVGIPLAPKSRALAGDAGLFFCIECRIKSSTRATPPRSPARTRAISNSILAARPLSDRLK
jgi:hypothetical protein